MNNETGEKTLKSKVKMTTNMARILAYAAVLVYLLGFQPYLDQLQESQMSGLEYYAVGFGIPLLVLVGFCGVVIWVTRWRVERLVERHGDR